MTEGSMPEHVRDLLADLGQDAARVTRAANGASNQVWLGERVVLRVGGADGALLREAALAHLLPAEVGYPAVVGRGVGDGFEWMATERLPGRNLAEAWPHLTDDVRCRAVEDLWLRLSAVRRTDVEQARALGCTWTPFYTLELAGAMELLESLTARSAIEPETSKRLAGHLERMFASLDGVPTTLVHTDAGPHNTVWTGTAAIPVDFEFVCLGPADLDLEMLFRSLNELRDPGASDHLVRLAAPLLELPGARERLRGYAVLRDLWALNAAS